MPEIIGFSDGVELSYTQISSSDPIISLLLANVLPDVKVQDFDITNAQAYQNGEEIVPAGEITSVPCSNNVSRISQRPQPVD